jgi:GGDEF domain-containing protein
LYDQIALQKAQNEMDGTPLQIRLSEYQSKLQFCEQQIDTLQGELQRLRNESIHDEETHLFSSAYFYARLQEEILRSERYRHFFSLVLLHVDFNDNYSPPQITHELQRIGRELTLGLSRRTDIVAMYRKRQMILMLPETDPRGVTILLQRCQAMFPSNGSRLVCSALTYPNDASNIELVLNRLQELSEKMFRNGGAKALS